jgi:hypothetical protein
LKHLLTHDHVAAAEEYARQVVDANHFVYDIGNASRALSSKTGRVLGTFGTWPTNYLTWLCNGIQANGDKVARATFIKRAIATNAAIMAVGTGVFGVNLSQQLWLGPVAYSGGPFTKIFYTGAQAIGSMGSEYFPRAGSAFLDSLPAIVPGFGAARDYYRAFSEDEIGELLKRVAGKRSIER